MDTCLDELVSTVKTTFHYNYDVRNPWTHKITLENIGDGPDYPICLDGEGDVPTDENDRTTNQRFLSPQTMRTETAQPFNIAAVNKRLRRYAQEWEEIYAQSYEGFDEEDAVADSVSYEDVSHLKVPQDVLTDPSEKERLKDRLTGLIAVDQSPEQRCLNRFTALGHAPKESQEKIMDALAIERFYELKYGIHALTTRYNYNLDRLPQAP